VRHPVTDGVLLDRLEDGGLEGAAGVVPTVPGAGRLHGHAVAFRCSLT
jgi:hypothetical protein